MVTNIATAATAITAAVAQPSHLSNGGLTRSPITFLAARQENDQHDQWGRKHTIQDGRPKQHLHGVEAGIIEHQTQDHRRRDDSVEFFGKTWLILQRATPIAGLRPLRRRQHRPAQERQAFPFRSSPT